MKYITNTDLRLEVYNKTQGRCAYCGNHISYDDMEVDHIIAQSTYHSIVKHGLQPTFLKHLSVDDLDHIDNLHSSCNRCNTVKSNKPLEYFRKKDQLFYYETHTQLQDRKKNINN